MNKELVTCCICGKEISYDESNNPSPLYTGENDRCCHDCNEKYIQPTRNLIGYEPQTSEDEKELLRIRESIKYCKTDTVKKKKTLYCPVNDADLFKIFNCEKLPDKMIPLFLADNPDDAVKLARPTVTLVEVEVDEDAVTESIGLNNAFIVNGNSLTVKMDDYGVVALSEFTYGVNGWCKTL